MSAVRAATVGIGSPVVLVGHGDACRFLPAIGRDLPNEVLGFVFVDGCLPPDSGRGLLASERFLERVRSVIRDGADPRSSWFRCELPRCTAIEDRAVRAVMSERARLPLFYFHDRVPMPAGWAKRPRAYLCLGEQTGCVGAARARAYGWPVATLRGAHHLSIGTDPEAVTAVLLELTGELSAPASYKNTDRIGTHARRGVGISVMERPPHGPTGGRWCERNADAAAVIQVPPSAAITGGGAHDAHG
jgi:hypothetical protein